MTRNLIQLDMLAPQIISNQVKRWYQLVSDEVFETVASQQHTLEYAKYNNHYDVVVGSCGYNPAIRDLPIFESIGSSDEDDQELGWSQTCPEGYDRLLKMLWIFDD